MANTKDIVVGVSGAPESSAGDDFHLLWAARKVLQLLLPNARLQALSIEGPAPGEARLLDPDGDQLLTVDIAEYFGGTDFTTADCIILSQLKYSTRHPSREWSAARLCEGKTHRGGGSIVHRLAQAFDRYYSAFDRPDILGKLRLKLVSNRPISSRLESSLATAKTYLSQRAKKTRSLTLFNQLQNEDRTELERLYSASRLGSYKFTDFLRVLDVSDCGELSRFGQRIELVKEIGRSTVGEVQDQYEKLKGLIHARMMPEARQSNLLTREDILPIFGLSTYRTAYPAEPKFNLPSKMLPRTAAAELAEVIVTSPGKPICLRSGGGRGKTVLVHMLEERLPQGSFVVVFDGFGGGTYRNPADVRHTHRRAIPQIANELAARSGVPLLLSTDLPTEDLLREFVGRVEATVSLVTTVNQEAVVVIVIDAADNSVYAAREKGERSFVHDLLNQPFPDGSQLIVSTRTENADLLDLPDHELFDLEGFSSTETSRHLHMYFPDATDHQTAEFHRLTHGIPRTQGYALDYRQDGLEAVLSPLRPSGKSLSDLIEERILKASERSGAPASVDSICEALVALPRPVPLAYAANLAGVSPSAVDSFCVDVGFGVLLDEDGTITLRDQDFEDHLRQRVSDVERLAEKIADHFYGERDHDPYAVNNLNTFLARTGRFEALRDVVLEEGIPDIIDDPLERQEITLRRIQSALEMNEARENRSDVLKLLFVAAETTKTDAAVRRVIEENSELVTRFGGPTMVQRLHQAIPDQQWPLPDLYHAAAVLSRFESSTGRATEYLREAEGWLRRRSCVPKEKWHEYPIEIEDIAAGAEAILRIRGVESAYEWLSLWTPKNIAYQCAYHLTTSVLRVDGVVETNSRLAKIQPRADILLAILRAFSEANLSLPRDLVKTAAETWCRFGRMGQQPDSELFSDGLLLCEAAAREKLSPEMLRELFALFSPPPIDYVHSLYQGQDKKVDELIRSQALRVRLERKPLSIELFLPDELKGEDDTLSDSDSMRREEIRRDFDRVFTPLLPAYELRADGLLGFLAKEETHERLLKCLKQFPRGFDFRSRHDAHIITRLFSLAMADVILLMDCSHEQWIIRLTETVLTNSQQGENGLRLYLAERIVSTPSLYGEALRLLDEATSILERSPGPASETIDFFLRCAQIAEIIDPEVGKHYFDLAIKTATEIDEDALSQLACLADLADKAISDKNSQDPKLAYQFAQFAEACHDRLYGWDDFPWMQVVTGITTIDAASGFALLSRWDDRGVLAVDDEILSLLSTVVRRDFMSPASAYSLGILAQPFDRDHESFTSIVLDHANAAGDRKKVANILSMVEDDIQLHTPLGWRGERASTIVSWVGEHGYSNASGTESLSALATFTEGLSPSSQPELTTWSDHETRDDPDWDAILGARTFLNPREIIWAIDAVSRDSPVGAYAARLELVNKLQDRCHARDYVAQLDALLGVDEEHLPFEFLLPAIKSRLKRWHGHPGVRRWQESNSHRFLEARFQSFCMRGAFERHRFREFTDVFEVQDNAVFDLIMQVVPRWIPVPPRATYEVIRELIPSLTSHEANSVLRWALSRAKAYVQEDDADGPWKAGLCPPREPKEALGAFCWRLLGHPDKRVRWRAVHAVRRMVRLGEGWIIDSLIANSKCTDCEPFHDSGSKFFWLSAKVWLFILLDRLAKEASDLVGPHAKQIAQEALAPDIPHALIRHFAKSTALCLSHQFPDLYDEETCSRLYSVGTSPFPVNNDEVTNIHRRHLPSPDDAQFWFGMADTIPYWFGPLGDVFGESGANVARKADRWITDVWGITNEMAKQDRTAKRTIHDYNLISNNHGSEPIIETLQTYAEWHAMFCVAGELLDTYPTLTDHGEIDPYSCWLGRWTLSRPDCWLADARDPTPLEPIFWDMAAPKSADWIRETPPERFELAIGLPESHPGFLVLNGWFRRAKQDATETTYISSALVTPETASALLACLQTAADPRSFRVPLEGDNLEIAQEGFQLTGWLKHLDSEWGEGLDRLDPLRNDLTSSLVGPGEDFEKWGDLICSPDRKRHWLRGDDEHPVTIFECWDDLQTRGHRYPGFYSEGYRLWVRIETLLAYLGDRGRCLIVKCMIDRWQEKRGLDEHVPAKAKIYLFQPDGTLESLGERHRFGKAPG